MTPWHTWIELSHPDAHAAATGATGLVLPARYPPRKRKGPRANEAPVQLSLPFEDRDHDEEECN